MKHPVLRVSRGVRQYDDSRQDELSAENAVTAPEPRRRTRRRPPLFVPLLVLFLTFAAVLQIASSRDTLRFGGWAARVRADPGGDALLVAVSFSSLGRTSDETTSARVHLLLQETGAAVDIFGALSAPITILRATIAWSGARGTLKAEITVGEEHRTLALRIACRR